MLLNAADFPSPADTATRVAGAVAFLAVIWFAVLKPGPAVEAPEPSRNAVRVYWLCVVFEVIAIPVGAQVITRAFERPDLVILWVVLVVGVHFVPFAKAFSLPLFGFLGWTLVGIAAAGTAAALTVDAVAAPVAGVAAGFILLGFSGFSRSMKAASAS